MSKEEQFNHLLETLSTCKKCLAMKKQNGTDCSLINIYKNNSFAKNIPSIWTDWYHRLNSDLMIIGQDWGPYIEMEKLYNQYERNKTIKNWYDLIDSEKSLTKKMLEKYLLESASENEIFISKEELSKFYITNAIMCARSGTNYRGDNIKLKESTLNCSEFLKKQIDIVNPKVIVTLGYYPLLALSNIYNFKIAPTITATIQNYKYYQLENIIIIPAYHPAAQIPKERQIAQYNRIWEHIKGDKND